MPLDLVILAISCGKNEYTGQAFNHSFYFTRIDGNNQVLSCAEEITKEQLLEIMDNKIEEIEESIEKESLLLLKEQLIEQTFGPAIIKGLLENLHAHPHCKYLAYLLRQYYNF